MHARGESDSACTDSSSRKRETMNEQQRPPSIPSRPTDFFAQLRETVRDDADDRALLLRWERLAIAVRCGLDTGRPELIRLYLGCGQRLLREGIGKPVPMYAYMLRTLAHAAEDIELPGVWRELCAEHFDVPLARLRHPLGQQDPVALNALLGRVDSIRRQLANGGSSNTNT